MKQQTAVEWLQDRIKETYEKEGKLPLAYTLDLIKIAKGFEKLQSGYSYFDMKSAYAAGFTDGKTWGIPDGDAYIQSLNKLKFNK